MRILFLTDNYLPHAGGARVYYHELYRGLVRRYADTTVHILTKRTPGWQAFDSRECDDRLKISRKFKPLPNWKYGQLPKIAGPFLHALPFLLRRRVDVVHFGDLYPQGVICLALKRLLGVRYIAYCHGEEITVTDHFRYQPRVRNAVLQAADAVIAANEFARQNLIRIGVPAARVHKILPGVDRQKFRPGPADPALVKRLGLENKLVLLTVGRLTRRKNHDAVFDALAAVGQEFSGLAYLIVGTGEERDRLERRATDLGLGQTVRFVGQVSDEELADYYRLADVFVLPNRAEASGDVEGFGMVFIEANACGKPVIGGRSGGALEAIVDGQTGLLVDPNNIDDLISALRSTLRDRALRQRMAQAALRHAQQFDWDNSVKLLRAVSEEVLGSSVASGAKSLSSSRLGSSSASDQSRERVKTADSYSRVE